MENIVSHHKWSEERDQANLPLVLVHYLRWLATQPPILVANRQRHVAQRGTLLTRLDATLEQSTNPGRIASNTAALAVAWHTFGAFLEQQGLWRAERVRAWLSMGHDHLSRLALAQGTLVTEERASLVFLQAVRSLVASGRAILHDLEGGTPEVAPAQVLIGGVDRTGTYLMTPTTYDLVCEYKRRAGQVVPWSQRALVQMLEQDGLLVSTDSDGRHKAVWHLPVHVFGDR